MKTLMVLAAALCLFGSVAARAEGRGTAFGSGPTPVDEDMRTVAPVLEKYAKGVLNEDLWKRPNLSLRDRSIVTLAALIARNQTEDLEFYMNVALDHDVRPGELSEIITHLAFYTGWSSATAALPVARRVFAARKIGVDQLPTASDPLLPFDEAAEAERASRVGQQFGNVAPGLVQYTTDVLFRDLWLRPGLSPRVRSLVTISALIATGQVAQLGSHLGRAMDNGLSKEQAGEVITHLAFYAGWPAAFSALPIAKEVFERRAARAP
jgi:4-carboxymuconolactone decarboxylase